MGHGRFLKQFLETAVLECMMKTYSYEITLPDEPPQVHEHVTVYGYQVGQRYYDLKDLRLAGAHWVQGGIDCHDLLCLAESDSFVNETGKKQVYALHVIWDESCGAWEPWCHDDNGQTFDLAILDELIFIKE